jgi:hypothetical protein
MRAAARVCQAVRGYAGSEGVWGRALGEAFAGAAGEFVASRAAYATGAAAALQVLGEAHIKAHGRWQSFHRPVHSLYPQGAYVPSSQEER